MASCLVGMSSVIERFIDSVMFCVTVCARSLIHPRCARIVIVGQARDLVELSLESSFCTGGEIDVGIRSRLIDPRIVR